MTRSWCLVLLDLFFYSQMIATADTSSGSSLPLCTDPSTGAIVALIADTEAYVSIQGGPLQDKPESAIQQWTFVQQGDYSISSNNNNNAMAPASFEHPFTASLTASAWGGAYLQVLPHAARAGRLYPEPAGKLQSVDDELTSHSPYVQFRIRPTTTGWHTLFLRWTGGADAGNALYASLHQQEEAASGTKTTIVTGQPTVRPLWLPIDTDVESIEFDGCCYDATEHVCPCYETKPPYFDCEFYIDQSQAAEFKMECEVGGGAMELLSKPTWYLFASLDDNGDGNDATNEFEFSTWDVSCEANGATREDSGRDAAMWYLQADGEYQLRIYAREDQTALNAIYLAGPDASAPPLHQDFGAGDTTFCSSSSSKNNKKHMTSSNHYDTDSDGEDPMLSCDATASIYFWWGFGSAMGVLLLVGLLWCVLKKCCCAPAVTSTTKYDPVVHQFVDGSSHGMRFVAPPHSTMMT